MTNRPPLARRSRRAIIHRWIRFGFLGWAVLSTGWLVQSFRTRGVEAALLESDERTQVENVDGVLAFVPRVVTAARGLVFLVGGGVAPEAYAPLLRPLADAGHPIFVVGLPYRLAPLENHKTQAVARARALLDSPRAPSWVLAGHSLGAALACRLVASPPERLAHVVLIATSHPKRIDLSRADVPMTKITASRDGVASPSMIDATRALLPASTRWVVVEGGNHSQFAHYGRQLFDGSATIGREAQQAVARAALLDALTAPR